MKIGIITLLGNNYGNRLQNYAVQELLKSYGEVKTVRYEKRLFSTSQSAPRKRTLSYLLQAIDSRLQNLYHLSNRRRTTIGRLLYFIKHRKDIKRSISMRNRKFADFDKKYISYETEKLHIAGDAQSAWVKSYQAWVCGSDQIWNPCYPTATPVAFLQFTEHERRIALSASMGITDLTKMLPEYPEWLSSIPYLSVREEQAVNLIHQLSGRTAELLLDPTMLIEREKWEIMADNAQVALPDNFALTYFLGIREKEYENYINRATTADQLKRVDLLNAEYPEYLKMDPADMINAVRKAKVVFTDSFHGVVFSIIFHKPVVIFIRSEEGASMNSRIETLLKKFNLSDRLFNGKPYIDLPVTNFENCDAIIEEERKKAHVFLNSAFGEISKLPANQPDQSERMIKIHRKEHCFGCGACATACPKQCISMVADEEGFLYPHVNKDICINCGKCVKTCPYYHRKENQIEAVYAAINHNSEIRSRSSSGGTFYQICKHFIEEGGVVYGCAWDIEMKARHIRINKVEDIKKLQGSKYVRSDLGNTYTDALADLKSGLKVVYSGTPCQIAGLKNFLGKNYPQLLTVDVLCHGTPSPSLFSQYTTGIEKRFKSRIIDMNLRDKNKSWHRLHTAIQFENGKEFYTFCGYDTYMSAFLTNMSQRPSCFECKFTTSNRQGDITLGDFWGIGVHISKMDDNKGTSMVIINSPKGAYVWQKIRHEFIVEDATFEIAESANKVLSVPPVKNPNRDNFYKTFAESGYEAAATKWIRIPGKAEQLYYDFMRFGLDIYRFIFNKKY